MQNSLIYGYSVEDVRHMYVTEKLSWDEIAIKCGKVRSSVIKRVKRIITEQVYAQWQALRNNKSAGSDLYEGKPEVEPVSVQSVESQPEPKKEPLKYIARPEGEGIKYSVITDAGTVIVVASTMDETLAILKAIEAGDAETIHNYATAMSRITAASGITYDSVAKTFNLGGIELEEKYQQLIVKGYEDLKQGNDSTLNGLIRLIHRLNKSNKLNILDQLYEFLKHNDIEILSNGLIVGYKYLENTVNGYYDHYTKTIKQKAKDYVYTQANKVNPDKDTVCSHGLHTASWGYVSGMSTIAKVIIDPLDVVSIPTDYDGQKMRSKGYYIYQVLTGCPKLEDFIPVDVDTLDLDNFNPVFVQETGGEYPEEEQG